MPWLRITELRLPLDHAPDALREAVLARLGITAEELRTFSVFRRGWDARGRARVRLVYTVDAELPPAAAGRVLAAHEGGQGIARRPDMRYPGAGRAPSGAPRPVVVGAGPCGLFAALILAQAGFRPIVLERGRMVRQRTRDTWALWRRGVLTPESNVQFGEGGAGTFSDGKLHSGVSDPRHLGRKVLEEFVRAGAPEEILVSARPHIGTFRLVSMVEHIRATIEGLGGEYRFETRVDDLVIETTGGARRLRGLVLAGGETLRADHVVLAPGHSARDLFARLHERGVAMAAKPLSIGVRIEHPQGMIDRARFGADAGNPILGAADYKLVHQASSGRGVYSFCMCPGGTVVAATSEPGRVVTNGMSQYSRNERNANAAIVVGISPADFPDGPLGGIAFQRHWESAAFAAGGGGYRAPAQLVGDFLGGRASTALGDIAPSYRPGVTPTDLAACLPDFAVAAIREALPAFARRIPGFDRADAVMTGVETRTSSPVRLLRGENGESVNTAGLYPAGEGAGFAGGILTAAIDGIRAGEAAAAAIIGATARAA